MSDVNLIKKDEIDLIMLLKIFWNNKWMVLIIIILTTIIGFVFSSKDKITYVSHTKITPSYTSNFTKYNLMNQFLLNHNTVDVINSHKTFEMFVSFFKDRDFLFEVLNNSKYINDTFSNENKKSKINEVLGNIKFYKHTGQYDYRLELEGYDNKQTNDILDLLIDETKSQTKKSYIKLIKIVISDIEQENLKLIKKVEASIDVIDKLTITDKNSKNMEIFSKDPNLERRIMYDLKTQNLIEMNKGLSNLRHDIKNNILKTKIDVVIKDDYNKWINHEPLSSYSKGKKSAGFYLIFLLIGFVLSSIYVFIIYNLKNFKLR